MDMTVITSLSFVNHMKRFRNEPPPRPLPADPRGRAVRVKSRVAKQRATGRFAKHDQIRDERIADYKRRLEEQIEADQRPVTEMVPEYVLDYDDDDNYIGLKPAK